MNEMIIDRNLWLAYTKRGEILCYGNPNEGLSYHLTSWLEPFDNNVVRGERRWEIMEHIKKWNKECKNGKDCRCKPVKVAITIKEIKKEK